MKGPLRAVTPQPTLNIQRGPERGLQLREHVRDNTAPQLGMRNELKFKTGLWFPRE